MNENEWKMNENLFCNLMFEKQPIYILNDLYQCIFQEKGIFWGGLLPAVVSGHQVTRGYPGSQTFCAFVWWICQISASNYITWPILSGLLCVDLYTQSIFI